jgi:hypothetical protein
MACPEMGHHVVTGFTALSPQGHYCTASLSIAETPGIESLFLAAPAGTILRITIAQ